ncbi:MAG: glycosyltransferase family 1 protein [Verrucomicrobiota bacterium]
MPNKYDPLRMFYGRVVARQLARRQDHIIAVSRQTAADIEKFFRIEPRRLSVILNGLDHTRFHPERAADRGTELARRWNLDRPFFLYTSRLEHPGKNHVRLIEAFARFKAATTSDWLLALAGTDWHGAPAIHQAADRSTARADIRFLGFVPDDDLPTLYRTADCLVYPSLFEGFGFPPIEAMACGCPVLSSTRGALAEVVADAAGILDPEDVPQMQDCLAKIVRDLPWREQLRQAGLKNAQRFHWTRNSDAVIACYRNVEKSNHRNV